MNNYIFERILKSKTIQIFGSAGSGKSTLVMSLMKKLLIGNTGKIFLIDTESKFSLKRFKRIIISESMNKISNDLLDSIMVTRPKTFKEQYSSIVSISNYLNLCSDETQIKAVIMDSASFYYRTTSLNKNWVEFSNNTHKFYEDHILPLLILQKQTGCFLILVHQVSYHPDKGLLPYLSNLFKKIPSLWIELRVNKFRNLNEMRFNFQKHGFDSNYVLSNSGFLFE